MVCFFVCWCCHDTLWWKNWKWSHCSHNCIWNILCKEKECVCYFSAKKNPEFANLKIVQNLSDLFLNAVVSLLFKWAAIWSCYGAVTQHKTVWSNFSFLPPNTQFYQICILQEGWVCLFMQWGNEVQSIIYSSHKIRALTNTYTVLLFHYI